MFRAKDGNNYILKVARFDPEKESVGNDFDHRQMQEPCEFMTVKFLPENSYDIRLLIWEHLQVQLDSRNQLREI